MNSYLLRGQRKLELANRLGLMPGVARYLDEAERLKLKVAIASSSTREWIDGHLQRLGIDQRFTCVVCAGDVSRVKPDPEIFSLGTGATRCERE